MFQLEIRNLYLSHENFHPNNPNTLSIICTLSTSSTDTTTNESSVDHSSHHNGTTIHEKIVLEIAAEQMRLYAQKKICEEQHSIEELEEQTLYALVIHYIQLMIYIKLPLDISSVRDANKISTVGSHDNGNGFDLNNDDQVTDLVLSFVRNFVNKICDESGVNITDENSLHTKLYLIEKVYHETRKVASIPKPLLSRFVITSELSEQEESIALHSYLLPDGRNEFFVGQNSLLLAEGALIMTNYRLIFKVRPVNPVNLSTHQTMSLKSNGTNSTGFLNTLNGSTRHQPNILIRTLEPVRRSLTLANTRSPKSLS
ncbi:unnamed protein product [Rotaria sp. Silwood2]|nr:unnamed protein product [Rotaria sp. Silwood2]CAF4121506.1 unnamed protein product [Rotaria sp. Silwood2]